MNILMKKCMVLTASLMISASCFAMEAGEQEPEKGIAVKRTVEDLFNRESALLFDSHFDYDYGLRRGKHELHTVAMGIGHGLYRDVSNDAFTAFVQKFAEKYQDQFKTQSIYKDTHYTPLGSIFGPDCMENPWSDKQIEQAKILFNIYKEYESAVPKARTEETKNIVYFVSLLDSILGQDTCPRTRCFVDYYKQLFEQNVENCDDEEFLKYAYVFFQMKDPENPALQKIRPRKVDPTEWFKILGDARVEDPYEMLKNILNSKDNWRLCMDFRQQRAGKTWEEYDAREPGTISSLIEGFHYILEHREPISYEYINTLWKTATKHRKDDIDQRGKRFGCHFPETTLNFMLSFKERYGHVATLEYTAFNDVTFVPFIFMKSPFSINSMQFEQELKKAERDYKKTQKDKTCFEIQKILADYVYQMGLLQYRNICDANEKNREKESNWTKDEVTQFIDQFNLTNNNLEATFEQKVLAAIKLVQALEVTHEHLDVNARRNVVLTLSKLLMDLQLPPPMFEYPMAIDGKTPVESLPLVIEAIENCKSLSHLFGIKV